MGKRDKAFMLWHFQLNFHCLNVCTDYCSLLHRPRCNTQRKGLFLSGSVFWGGSGGGDEAKNTVVLLVREMYNHLSMYVPQLGVLVSHILAA